MLDRQGQGQRMKSCRLVIGDAGRSERGNVVFVMDQRSCGDGELSEFVDDGLSFRGVAPDADSLVGGGFPGGFVDDDGVPADLPFES